VLGTLVPSEPAGGRTRRRAGDRGAATVWAVGGIAALFLIVGLVAGLGAAAVTRHRASSAADLAALAAAAYASSGEESACARAGRVAREMRVRLTACRLRGWDAEVEILAEPPDLLFGFGSATARARAGPVD
jgi:secretion/DNA translocation related TadE-like protein